MKSNVINTSLSLIALATMALAANNARANHDHSERYGQVNERYSQVNERYGESWREQDRYLSRKAQRASEQRLAEINQRQAKQHDRIHKGLDDHALTQREFRSLMAEQQRIRSWERSFTADGFLSKYEFQKLDLALDTASRNIRAEKRDHQSRDSGYGNYRYYN